MIWKILIGISTAKNLNTENIKICGSITKPEATEIQLVAFSSMSAEYLQKI